MEKKYRAKQASDSLLVGSLLSISGGLQDAYTYNIRDKVYANAQTGNIILLGQSAAEGQWGTALRYLLPVLAFVVGILLTEQIHNRFKVRGIALHWRHGVLLAEVVILAVVGFLPQQLNWLANVLVSLACAMQVQSFRELEGNSYATTMCIGNLRSGTENFYYWWKTRDETKLHKAKVYYVVILFFLLGATLGSVVSSHLAERTVLLCCPLLLLAAALMLRIRDRHLRFLALMTGAVEDEAILTGSAEPQAQ